MLRIVEKVVAKANGKDITREFLEERVMVDIRLVYKWRIFPTNIQITWSDWLDVPKVQG